MSKHPINLAVRFFLEMATLVIFGLWGWQLRTDTLRYLLAVTFPLAAAVIWGTFRVPKDPGDAPVAIPGILRLFIEFLFFSAAALALFELGPKALSWIFVAVVLLHYAVSFDRIIWLINR